MSHGVGQVEMIQMSDVVASDGERLDFTGLSVSSPAPPSFLLGNCTPEVLRTYFSRSIVFGTSLYMLAKAEVMAEGVVLSGRRAVVCNELNLYESYIRSHHTSTLHELGNKKAVKLTGRRVLLAGPGDQIYGHWIVDFLPKLYILERAGLPYTEQRYILPDDTPAFALIWLDLLGISREQLEFYGRWSDVLEVETLIVPTALRVSSRVSPLFPKAVEFLLSCLKRKIALDQEPINKIYVSRTKLGSTGKRKLENSAMLEQMALDAGYSICYPETLSIPAQLSLFANAKTLVGEYGSGLHASMFASDKLSTCALRNVGIELGFLQSGLGEVMQQKTGYIFGGTTDDSSFSIDERDFSLALELLTG